MTQGNTYLRLVSVEKHYWIAKNMSNLENSVKYNSYLKTSNNLLPILKNPTSPLFSYSYIVVWYPFKLSVRITCFIKEILVLFLIHVKCLSKNIKSPWSSSYNKIIILLYRNNLCLLKISPLKVKLFMTNCLWIQHVDTLLLEWWQIDARGTDRISLKPET